MKTLPKSLEKNRTKFVGFKGLWLREKDILLWLIQKEKEIDKFRTKFIGFNGFYVKSRVIKKVLRE